MNKKEINEIKRLLTPANCAISRICGCYVDADKNRRTEIKEAFLSLPDEEAFKYFNILRGSLSGSIEKNLINMEFPINSEAEGGTQDFLLRLRDSQLKDDILIEEFYNRLIENYEYNENYYIILIHCVYDIPSKSTDGVEMYDASDYVYEFIQCAICPVNLSKAGLCYNSVENTIQNRNRDWLVGAPSIGFLFPAFNDRNTDVHSLLFYTKKADMISEGLIDKVLGCVIPMSAGEQKRAFQTIIEETLGENCDFDSVRNIHESLNEILEETKDQDAPFILDTYQIEKLLESNGANQNQLIDFEQKYEKTISGKGPSFMATNVAHPGLEIKTTDINIRIAPERTHMVENRMIDGRPCIVIEISDRVMVNGIAIKPKEEK